MTDRLSDFESIGDNCELGFVLKALGEQTSSLLRWAFLDSVEQTASAIRTGFKDVFSFENLKPAGGGTMVRDVAAGIAFHTDMRSVQRGQELVFTAPEAERREIHAREAARFAHLRAKFLRDLAEGAKCYVVKRNDGLTEAQAGTLFEAIRLHGPGRLLYVTATADPHRIGTAEPVRPGLMQGWIDRFAPYSHADDVSQHAWERLLHVASALA